MSTSEKLITKHSNLFPRVELVPTSSLPQFNGMTFNSWEQNAIIIHNDNGGFHLGSLVSEKYHLIKNEDIFLPIADKLDSMFGPENINVRVRASQPYEYHVYFEVPKYGTKELDSLHPMSSITNSYTGQVKASQIGMVGRLICTNGMMTISNKAKVFDIKHTKKEAKIFLDMAQILNDTEQVFADFGLVIEHREVMNAVKLSALKGKNNTEKFETLIKGTNFPKKQIETAFNIANSEAAQLKQNVTLWLAYNALNHILWHDKQSKMTEKMKNELDSKLVTKVHKLALELA
jgi:hypothetical protein